jgi:hypothetical protein
MNVASMLKAYVRRSWYPKESEALRHHLQVAFTSKPEGANWYDTRQEAESDCANIFNRGIVIDSSEGGKQTLRNFRVEERKPGEFVIFCEGPFIMKGQSKIY